MMILARLKAAETLRDSIASYRIAQPKLHAYALIYGVAFPRFYGEIQSILGATAAQKMSPIFSAVGEDQREQYGPFLVHLADSNHATIILTMAQRCYEDPRGISFLFSRCLMPKLAAALQARLEVKCEDRTQWQMKFFDTRTLPVLARALSDKQRADYFAMIEQWWYLDREENLQKIAGSGVMTDEYHGPLTLSEAQTTIFIDAGLPDSVLHILGQTDDDLLAAFDTRSRYRIVADALVDATPAERDSSLMLADRARLALLDALKSLGQSS